MTTKNEAKEKINNAAKSCEKALDEWRAAAKALDGSISVNGYGIHHDRFELRYKLLAAQTNIQKALETLNNIDWPVNADYELAD